ncbi:glutathione synthase [Paragonimus westermani]|uniref:Glutathione synthetase n=1 Tax=Paragonimus westermani TaxID=34504 RepID=A0A5J4NR56_9TREM|nr:glutathione synthase [Paragonimus westermani]
MKAAPFLSSTQVPDCNSADNFADALWKACELYSEHVTRVDRDGTESRTAHGAVLMVVAVNETNVYDQYALLSRLLLRHPEATVLVRTFEELVESKERLQLDDQSRLFVDKTEVAVVYFRHGYVPEHFPSEEFDHVIFDFTICADDLVRMLETLMEQGDQRSYVIMERLYPFVVENYVLCSKRTHDRRQMVSELGIFGVFIGRGDDVFLNEPSGHLLRTKPIESNEGGIAAGYGFLDSPFLV